MRRKDKEITDIEQIGEILKEAEVIRIAMVDGSEPYLVAMNYVFFNGCIYMHSAKEGRKIDVLKKNKRVAFQADIGAEIILKGKASDCTTKYMSVFGTGKAIMVGEKEEKKKALDALMTKHTGDTEFEYPENVFNNTLIIKIEIDYMSGKKSLM